MVKRNKRGLGRLLSELRPKPLFLILFASAGTVFLAGAVAVLPFLITLPVDDPSRSGVGIKGSLVTVFVLLGLGGVALLVITFLQRSAGVRVHEHGVVYQRFWGKRVIRWLDVRDVYQQYKEGYAAPDGSVTDRYWWRLHLQDGTRYDFHDTFYDSNEYMETMVALLAEFKRFREAWNMKYGPV